MDADSLLHYVISYNRPVFIKKIWYFDLLLAVFIILDISLTKIICFINLQIQVCVKDCSFFQAVYKLEIFSLTYKTWHKINTLTISIQIKLYLFQLVLFKFSVTISKCGLFIIYIKIQMCLFSFGNKIYQSTKLSS